VDELDELDELDDDEEEELELEDEADEDDEDEDEDADEDEDELEEPELEELPALDDELGVGVGVPGVSSPQPTRRVPAAIDAAPDNKSRN